MKKIISILFLTIMISACSKEEAPETALFDIAGGFSQKVNTEIDFWPKYSDDNNHSWDFGDGSTASGSFVQHTYTKIGTYTIRHTASNSKGSVHFDQSIYIY